RTACALVLHPRRSDGHRRDYSQLEQGLASLVLVILAAHLAHQLLPGSVACPPAGSPHVQRSRVETAGGPALGYPDPIMPSVRSLRTVHDGCIAALLCLSSLALPITVRTARA